MSFSSDTPPAVRMRLEYETARLALLSFDRMTVPLDFEFKDASSRIICPWTPGRTLAEQLASSQLSVATTLSIAEDILIALEDLHQHGLIRRCLLPREIIVEESAGSVAAFIGGYGPLMMLQGLQNAAVAMEVAAYTSPEALGALDEDVRASSDLYSLGILLFECLTGRVPFAADTVGDLVFHHMTSPVPDPTSINPLIPRHFSDIVLRLLQKHPRDRYQSAAGVLYDLRQIASVQEAEFPQCLVLGTMDRRETLIEPAFVGRSRDMALLKSELESVAQGNSRTVLVTAASGLGKSRLMLEVSRVAVSHGFRVFRAQGQNQIGLAPLASLRQILSQCLAVVRQDATLRTHLQSELSEFGRELAAVVPELVTELALHVSVERTQDLSDRRIAIALATYFRAIGTPEKPVLILLDDMHWADDLTLTMLECWHLTNSSPTLLIVGTRSSDTAAERLRDNLKWAIKLSLDPLVRADHDQLLGSMTGGIPAQILTTVWEMSAGNPFMASAVLRGLVEGGVLTPSVSGWQVDERQLKNLQMSGEAAEVLKQRLFRLSKESQELLSVGAILGKDFSIEMAADLARIPPKRVLELLIEPRRNCLIWERASGSICSFMHNQIREAVLQTLTPTRRALIHRRAAEYLSRFEPHRVFDIAFHHDASGRSDLARDYAIEAAEMARTSHALESAEQQYRIAMRSFFTRFEEPDFRVLYGLGDVLMLSGRYQEAEPLFERAIQCADSATLRAQVTLKLGELAFKEDRKDRAIELWESALCSLGGTLPSAWMLPLSTVREIAVQTLHSLLPRWFVGRRTTEPSANDRLIWRLHSRLAYAYWFVRSKLHVLHVHFRGMNLAERYKPTAELAQAYSEHAPAMSLIPLSRRGIAYGRRSLQIRTEQNDIWGQGQSLHCLAIALYSAAQFEECVDVGRRSVRILERAGDFWEKHIAQYQVAASLYRLGRFTEAAQLSREAYDSGLAVGDFQVCGNIIEVWARATNGEIPQKILQCELDRPRADVQGQAHVLLAKGIHSISDSRFEDAVQALDQGIEAARNAGISNTYTSPLFAWKATALRGFLENKSRLTRSPRRTIIRQHRRAARKALLMALRFRNELPHALREYAWAHVFKNCNRRAIFLLQKSVQVARLQSAAYEEIQSSLLLHRIRLETGCPGAEKELENAERRYSAFRNEQLPQRMFSSISLVDRFDSLLESGRRIASAIDPTVIIDTVADAARRLLRCNFCEIIYIDESGQPGVQSEAIRACILTSMKAMDATAANGSGSDFRSLLACPIVVRARVAACLVVCNSEVRDLFGPNELRIARYLTTIAGAALENAEGFRSLQDLNANLERIVEDRTAVVEARSAELQETADHLRHVQTQLAAARDAAESASRAKSDFLAHMSHEIRTPIGAVLGFTELLLNGDAPLLPEQQSHLQRVLSNGNHLHRLLNDLLDLSRIEAGALTIESMECAPYAMFYDILSALQSRAIARNLKLTLRVANGIPEKLLTDPTRLRQILTNLIGNAIKFTNEGSVSLIVETDVAQNQLKVHVQDTGLGINLSAQKDIFEPFKQADETVARRFGGTGLGLSISRNLARALGGDIEVSSEPGFGSTFTVTIATGPLEGVKILNGRQAEATLAAPIAEAGHNLNLQGFRILITDDVEANREFFAHVLRRAHAECLFACDGQEAVETMRRESCDLILMDVQMPVMDGYAATTALRAAGVRIPIVAMTANGTEDDKQRCRDIGFTGYLTKPISIASLLRGVGEQLGVTEDQKPLPARREPAATAIQETSSPAARVERTCSTRPIVTLPVDPVFRDFATRFVRKVKDALPEIMSAIDDANSTTLSGLAHWIKGTGGTVGLPGLTEIGKELHTMAHTEDYAGARSIALELQSILATLERESQCEVAVR
ncbi:MAG: response regulator [Fuerstia sp.]|nr:response regulator [Fuerstiella sp.]